MSQTETRFKVFRCRWCGRKVNGVWGWFHKPDFCSKRPGYPHGVFCVTEDGRNLHDEGYCDYYGQDYNEWRG